MIEFKTGWREVACTAEPCVVCGEMILGKQYQLHTVINGKLIPMEHIACASCYVEIMKIE